jgi:hypothetical protein
MRIPAGSGSKRVSSKTGMESPVKVDFEPFAAELREQISRKEHLYL